ncbi:MAG TPA: helix-turn-helix domain-containing protein [Sphingomicrobium sp.]|nr:helix-turn-helix domain-containing protein [Sphingomicrobium sp.]
MALPIFDGVDRQLIERLLERCSARQYRAGALIVRHGELVPALHVVLRGIVDLTHISGKSECGVLLLSSKDLLLPATTVFQEPALVSARALTNSKILMLDGSDVQAALDHSTAFAANLMKPMSGQWRMAVRNILDLNCRSAAQRVGAFLLRLADLQSPSSAPLLPIAKRHLAVRLGITPETLSRMLQTVADHGLHLRGRTIVIRDRAAIEEFCGPDPYPQKDERPLNVFAL